MSGSSEQHGRYMQQSCIDLAWNIAELRCYAAAGAEIGAVPLPTKQRNRPPSQAGGVSGGWTGSCSRRVKPPPERIEALDGKGCVHAPTGGVPEEQPIRPSVLCSAMGTGEA